MDFNDTRRLILNLIRKGEISEIDLPAAKCRVATGDITTNWIPWFALRAGTTSTWNPPTVGEQVVVLSAGGDTAEAVALCGIYSEDVPAPSISASKDSTYYPDGAVIEYDHQTHMLSATLPIGGTAVIDAPVSVTVKTASITLDATETTCTGNLTVQKKLTYLGGMSGAAAGAGGPAANIAGDIVIDGRSFNGHTHMEQGDGKPVSAPI